MCELDGPLRHFRGTLCRGMSMRSRAACVRSDIKSSGKFAIFRRLKIEGGGGEIGTLWKN